MKLLTIDSANRIGSLYTWESNIYFYGDKRIGNMCGIRNLFVGYYKPFDHRFTGKIRNLELTQLTIHQITTSLQLTQRR